MTSTDPARTASTLTARMREALLSGKASGGTVTGRTGTICALIDRGLVTPGTHVRWTDQGRAVAHLLDPEIPATAPIVIAWRDDQGNRFEVGHTDALAARQVMADVERYANLTRIMPMGDLLDWLTARGVRGADLVTFATERYGWTEAELEAEYESLHGSMA